ncbi:helix-turn-helix domain-containing protein [Methanobacterium sp. YSL]|nr:helix-turn-helix domain-containing protein [Methanobacterium sp. YSL]
MNDLSRQNFKKFRTAIDITQEQMALFLGVEQSTVSKFESGDRNLSVSNLEKACALFGVTLDDLSKSKKVIQLAPSFRKTIMDIQLLQSIAEINQIALNIVEMNTILGKKNG